MKQNLLRAPKSCSTPIGFSIGMAKATALLYSLQTITQIGSNLRMVCQYGLNWRHELKAPLGQAIAGCNPPNSDHSERPVEDDQSSSFVQTAAAYTT